MRQIQQNSNRCGANIVFHIVSEGQPSDFDDLRNEFKDLELNLSLPSPNVNHCALRAKTKPARNQHLLNRRINGAAQAKMDRVSKLRSYRQGILSPSNGLSTARAFKLLVEADILVMSKSSFSYLAGIYSEGVKIFPEGMWWETPARWCEDQDLWFHVKNGKVVNVGQLYGEICKFSS